MKRRKQRRCDDDTVYQNSCASAVYDIFLHQWMTVVNERNIFQWYVSSLVVSCLRTCRTPALLLIEYLCNYKLGLHNHTSTTPRERGFLTAMLILPQIREFWGGVAMLWQSVLCLSQYRNMCVMIMWNGLFHDAGKAFPHHEKACSAGRESLYGGMIKAFPYTDSVEKGL